MAKTKISKETWLQVFSLKNYSDFFQEWLNLYDAFMRVNPPINKHTEFECLKKLVEGLLDKCLDQTNNQDEIDELRSLLHSYDVVLDSITFIEGIKSVGGLVK